MDFPVLNLGGDINTILGPLDVQHLGARKETTILRPGVRILHRRYIDPICQIAGEDAYIPLPILNKEYVEIPERLISEATLVTLGFTEAAAQEMWEMWTDPRHDTMPWRETEGGIVSFLSLPIVWIKTRGTDTTGDGDDVTWMATMGACGINPEIQVHLLESHPMYRHMRQLRSCKGWLEHTVRMRYRVLAAIRDDSRKREATLREATNMSNTTTREEEDLECLSDWKVITDEV